VAKNIITSANLRTLVDSAKEKTKGKVTCVLLNTKKGDILLMKVIPYGQRGLVFGRVADEAKEEAKKLCTEIKMPTRHVRKYKIGIREWNRFSAFMRGEPVTAGAKKGKYVPAYLVSKILLTPGRGVKRPRTTGRKTEQPKTQ